MFTCNVVTSALSASGEERRTIGRFNPHHTLTQAHTPEYKRGRSPHVFSVYCNKSCVSWSHQHAG